jgi:hypothetical protein
MCPGRFPSPTPSRETSPVLSVRTNSPGSPARILKQRSTSLNFTAPISSRKRPRFSDVQSAPNVPSSTPPAQSASHDRRRASDPLPNRTTTTTNDSALPISPRSINIKLQQKLSEPLTFSSKKGIVYILRDPARPSLGCKIGSTSAPDYRTRINEHARDCSFTPKVVCVSVEVECCTRVERLVQIDLEEKCKKWNCDDHAKKGKSVEHREWFDVSEDQAMETVRRWVSFVNGQKPYDWRERLSPMWSYLIRTRDFIDCVDHDARRVRWNDMLASPTRMDYVHFTIDTIRRIWQAFIRILRSVWPWCRDFFWQMLALVYGFVTLVAFRNTFASSAFALVSLCACISVAQPKLSRRLKSRS